MHLARIPLRVDPTPVVEPERHVRRLLDLVDHHPGPERMHRPRRDDDRLSGASLDLSKVTSGRAVQLPRVLHEPVQGDAVLQSEVQLRARLRIEHVPRFGLAQAIEWPGALIVRVHLDREVFRRVDQLREERKYVPAAYRLPRPGTEAAIRIGVDKLLQRLTGAVPNRDDRLSGGDQRLPDRLVRRKVESVSS